MSIRTADFLAEVVRVTGAAVVGWSTEGVVTLWSPAAQRLLGYGPEEVLGHSVRSFLVDPGAWDDGLLEVDSARGSVEQQVRHRDGTVVDLLLHAYPTAEHGDGDGDGDSGLGGDGGVDGDGDGGLGGDGDGGPDDDAPAPRSAALRTGAPVSVWVVLHDVSERKERERLAEATARRLALAQESAHVGSFEIDLVTHERWWSDEFWRILGIPAGSVPPTRELHLGAIHPGDRSDVDAQWARADRGEPSPEIEYRIVRPGGEVRWVRTRVATGVSEMTGRPMIYGTTMDVTDVATAYRQRYRALHSFQTMFRNSPVGSAIVGLDMRLEQVNPALCDIVGASAEELVGTPVSAFLPGAARDDDDDDLLPGAGPRPGEEREKRVLRADGSTVWVSATMSPVHGENGETTRYFLWVEDISERKIQERALVHQAFHDPLTGLPNRKLLTRRLERSFEGARQGGEQIAVLFIDVDEFKMVNDSLGHGAGDRLLTQLSQRLASALGGTDLLARFGGDEFVVVRDRTDAEGARRLADRLSEVARSPFVLGAQEIFVTVSVGITMASGHESITAVLRSSDSAMYRAKATGRGQVVMYTEDLHEIATSRLNMASHLGRALEREEFSVVYQPIVRLSDEQPVALEALLRWHDPELGLVAPLDFIPVAEETGLIVPLGEWVLDQALTQIRHWRATLPGCQRLGINVNVSGVQLRHPGFARVVEDAVQRTGVDPGAVELELTESIIMEDVEEVRGQLERLRALGAQISIDDFGTGYSSLAYLSQLPANTLKIDRTFIEALDWDANAASVLSAIVRMAQASGMTTVAEGIETPSQREQLIELGGHLGQGFLWSRPLPPEDVPGWLASR